MSTATVETQAPNPEKQKYTQDALALKTEALAIQKITSNEQYELACEKGRAIAALDKKIEEFFKRMKDPAYAAWKAVCNEENNARGPLQTAKTHYSGIIGSYLQEKERERQQEQLRLEAEARKKEEDARVAEAAALELEGKQEEAEEVLNTKPAFIPTPVAPKMVQKVAGVSGRTNWSAEVTDFKALVDAVSQGKAPILALQPNETFLNDQARSMKSLLSYPGVVAKDKSGTTFIS
jgi:hypothetical protein